MLAAKRDRQPNAGNFVYNDTFIVVNADSTLVIVYNLYTK